MYANVRKRTKAKMRKSEKAKKIKGENLDLLNYRLLLISYIFFFRLVAARGSFLQAYITTMGRYTVWLLACCFVLAVNAFKTPAMRRYA